MSSRALILASLLLFAPGAGAATRPDYTAELGFERTDTASVLSHWNGKPSGPAGTLFLDSTVMHGGRHSGRLERTTGSASNFSSFAYKLPVDFAGDTLELRGWLRLESVEGASGLWQRQDGPSGMLQFDNMLSRPLSGTADWAEYSVKLPLDRRASSVTVGSLLSGAGRVWADDLRLFIDGKPLALAPVKPVFRTVLETDTAFAGGSGISTESVTPEQLERLVLLGKVWGFLKYHHPAVVRGERHWDFDLFRVLPSVLAARDDGESHRVLSSWITKLGPVAPCKPCAKLPAKLELSPRLGWISDRARLGDTLSSQLVAIHENRPSVSQQFFVSLVPGIGNPDFGIELEYPRQADPDPGYALLALYRLWNIIEYWSPYRELADRDWDATLREFIPRFLAAHTKAEYKLNLIALIARVRDTHTNLWSGLDAQPPSGKAYVPVMVRFVEGKAVVVDYSNPRLGPATGLRVGDIISHVDGTPVDTLVARLRPYYPASNESARLREIAKNVTRGDSGGAQLSVVRNGKKLTLSAQRAPGDSLKREREWKHDHEGPTFRRLSKDLAYLKLSSVKQTEVKDYVSGTEGAKCLVIDLRNYPSQFMVFALGQHLVTERTPFVKFTAGDMQNPGAFAFGQPLPLDPSRPYVDCPVAILIDEVTQSQAEYTTMAFRVRPGTVVVGSQTAGADGNVSPIPLPGGQRTMISGIGIYCPDGTPTQGIGIVPDVEVKPTIAGIRAGRDEVLEAAVKKVLRRSISSSELQALRTTEAKPAP